MRVHRDALLIEDYFPDDYGQLVFQKTGKRVLLVEDSKSDVALIKRMIQDVSFDEQIVFADVPRVVDALELLDHEHFDLILLDLCLLDIDGVATVAALNAERPNTPIVVYSGSDDPKLKEEALMCGAKHYLVKGKESPFALKLMMNQAMDSAEL